MEAVDMFNINDVVDGCMKAVGSKIRNLNTLNIAVIGKTGVGKSTLINAIFREDVAETGTGKPVTDRMRKYERNGFPLCLYDTKGFELGKEAQEEVKRELIETIKEGAGSGDISRAIHCIWYCVNAASNRFEQEEVNWIKDFTEQNKTYAVPVIIVITKSYLKNDAREMKKTIEAMNLDVMQIVPVLSRDCEIDDGVTVKAYGSDKLIEVMLEALPDELADTLMYVQQANLQLKQKRAQAAITAATLSAAAAGASPIPFSDAALLVPIEIGMITSITVIFGFDFDKSVLTGLVSTILGAGAATAGGRAIVTNLLKMVPGIGTIAGGAISGGTAAMVTTALGEAYIGLMTAMLKGELKEKDLETEDGRKKFGRMFKKELRKRQG